MGVSSERITGNAISVRRCLEKSGFAPSASVIMYTRADGACALVHESGGTATLTKVVHEPLSL